MCYETYERLLRARASRRARRPFPFSGESAASTRFHNESVVAIAHVPAIPPSAPANAPSTIDDPSSRDRPMPEDYSARRAFRNA